MIITLKAMYAIECNLRHCRREQYHFDFELVDQRIWFRINFGDFYVPVTIPEHFDMLTVTLDYDCQKGGFFFTTPAPKPKNPSAMTGVCRE